MEDLSLALADHGVNAKKPDYCESKKLVSTSIVIRGAESIRNRFLSYPHDEASSICCTFE